MLLSTQNTKRVEKMALACARKKLRTRKYLSAHYEHGQWWIHVLGGPLDGAIYSVVDTNAGLDLEEVQGPYPF